MPLVSERTLAGDFCIIRHFTLQEELTQQSETFQKEKENLALSNEGTYTLYLLF